MKAVVLCAGQGTRLRPLTDACPKGMVKVGGRPILERQIELFRQLGVDDIVVVGGYRYEAIPDYGVQKAVNDEYASTNMVFTLFCAERLLAGADAVIVSYADILYSREVLAAALGSEHPCAVVVDLDWKEYFSRRMEDVLEDAESLQMEDGRITSIGAKVSSESEIEAQYIGLMKFRAEAMADLREIFFGALEDGSRIGWGRPARDAYMTDLLQERVDRGRPVHAIPIRGGWCEIDTLADFEIAEALLPRIEG